ncbi:MAG: NAD(P)-dependent oxidoreductase [Bacteroidetes bacterium]|nr:NAD(P)-dependent oxidoreductase [Bacteroidota bacterium]
MKQILIVGSNSSISRQLVDNLVENYKIDMAYSSENCGITLTHANFQKINLKNAIVSEKKYDFVIIISAFIPENNKHNIQKLFEVNVELIERITLKFSNSKIIFCSSVSVYTPKGEIIKESTSPNPINEYGLSKLWGEQIIKRNCKSYILFRISSIVGITMKSNTFIPKIIDVALTDSIITLFGNGERLQNYINVRDLCIMIEKSFMYQKNEVFLAVGESSFSNKQIAEIVQKYIPANILYEGVDNSFSNVYDSSYTKKCLNFNYSLTIENSIEEIIEWKRKKF